MPADFTIEGIQRLQSNNVARIASLRPSGALGQAIQWGTMIAHRYAVVITHVDTGALRAAHRMRVMGAEGRVYIDPAARNPRSGELPMVYGEIEHARGGSHAFYQRTVEAVTPQIRKHVNRLLSKYMKGKK